MTDTTPSGAMTTRSRTGRFSIMRRFLFSRRQSYTCLMQVPL